MNPAASIDGVLVQWGERLFYPSTRMVKVAPPPHLANGALHHHAGHIRQRIEATVLRRAPQVMVKVTGGGRSMAAIAAHFRYIAKAGRLPFEDDRGIVRQGKDALRDLAEQWRHGGSRIDETSPRREAFNIMLSMPAGTDPLIVMKAAREFAQAELADHRYVMVLHDHQANPHVHLSVRAESRHGKRLNPRKAELHRWRETFADKLRGWGVEAEATRQATRGEQRRYATLWQVKAEQEGRLHKPHAESKSGDNAKVNRTQALLAWAHITQALAGSDQPEDRRLAEAILRYVRQMPHFVELERTRQRGPGGQRELPGMSPVHIDPKPAEPEPNRESCKTNPQPYARVSDVLLIYVLANVLGHAKRVQLTRWVRSLFGRLRHRREQMIAQLNSSQDLSRLNRLGTRTSARSGPEIQR